jgi:hypothetical protein
MLTTLKTSEKNVKMITKTIILGTSCMHKEKLETYSSGTFLEKKPVLYFEVGK